ncbi:hypothetical protein B0H12DRAFT_1147291 [Mycena haematopus]|nr:hypothetical protein B0H12DRAFT_1147291 [Mycena haematopus]
MSDHPPVPHSHDPDGYWQSPGVSDPALEHYPPGYPPIMPHTEQSSSAPHESPPPFDAYTPHSSQSSPYYPPTPGNSTSIHPQDDYALPAGSVPPQSLADLPPSYEAAAEPAIVLYRDTMIHNPKSSDGLQKYGTIDADIEAILNCSKSSFKSEADSRITALVTALTQLGSLKMEVIVQEFPVHPRNHKGLTLRQFIENETKGDVQAGLFGLILGPLKYDVNRVQYAISSLPVKEHILVEILLELTPQESRLLAHVYHQIYKTPLMAHRLEVHGENWRLFKATLHPQRRLLADQTYDNLRRTLEDVKALHRMQDHRPKPEQEKERIFTEIFTGRTRQHLSQVCHTYLEKHNKPMAQVIRSSFMGDYRTALLFVVAGCEPDLRRPELPPQAIRDAKRIDETMAGVSTNKELLTMRVLRAHWSPRRMEQIIAAFPLYNEKHLQLSDRVKAEKGGIVSTQGFKDFKFFILALISGVPES